MNLSLGGLVKGVETGLTTLVETGNPYVAAGAAAVGCLTGNGSSGAAGAPNGNVPTFDPLLDSMSAELNPGTPPTTYSYAQLAGIDANGNSTQTDPYGGTSDADLVD